jgi:hypothetical protein
VSAASQGMPASPEVERFVLGCILLDAQKVFPQVSLQLQPDDFSREDHRRIYQRMCDLYIREEAIDRITVYQELERHKEAKQIGGLSYLVSLDDGLPALPNIDSYVRILKQKSSLRKILWACQNLTNRAMLGDPVEDIVLVGQETFSRIAARGSGRMRVADVPPVSSFGTAEIEYLCYPVLPKGTVVALTGDAGSGKSTLATSWARDVDVPVLFLDRENPITAIRDRLERVRLAPDTPRLRFWGAWCVEEAPMPDAPEVVEWVRLCDRAPLVIVDSLAAFHGGDQNDAGEMRTFMHRCRRLADLGATVIIIHHDGKSETAKDYRGSSDFKASIDCGFHVSNFSDAGGLGTLVLRPFKMRMGVCGEVTYTYADGHCLRRDSAGDDEQTVSAQLIALLRKNPGIAAKPFEDLAAERGLGRNRARAFIHDGVLSGAIRRDTGAKNVKRHSLADPELGSSLPPHPL